RLPVRTDLDLAANADLVGRNVDLAAIHFYVSVANDLASQTARSREAEAVGNVVQTTLKLLDETLAGNALCARSLLVVLAELTFEGEVNALRLLLFTKLQAVA